MLFGGAWVTAWIAFNVIVGVGCGDQGGEERINLWKVSCVWHFEDDNHV